MALKKRLDQLPAILGGDIENNDLMYLVHENENAETGYDSKKTTAADVGRKLLGGIEYVSELSNFPSGKQNGFDALEYLREFLIGQLPVITTSPAPIANFTTDLALPLVSLKANITATGGNGTPSTPVPIVGFSSANIKHSKKNLVVGTISNANVNSSGTISSSPDFDLAIAPIIKGATYIISGSNQLVCGFFTSTPVSGSTSYDGSRTVSATLYFTAPINGFVAFRVPTGTQNAQLEVGTEATAYETPTTPDTHTIDLGQTVYGGYLDLITGVLTITHGLLDLGDLTWTYNDSSYIGVPCFRSSNISDYKAGSTPYLCSCFAVKSPNRTAIDGDLQIAVYNNNNNNLVMRYDAYSDGEQVQTALTGQKLAYELATPVLIQLTPEEITAFLGTNNLWSDTNGDISASYRESIQKYIDEQIAAVQALIL